MYKLSNLNYIIYIFFNQRTQVVKEPHVAPELQTPGIEFSLKVLLKRV